MCPSIEGVKSPTCVSSLGPSPKGCSTITATRNTVVVVALEEPRRTCTILSLARSIAINRGAIWTFTLLVGSRQARLLLKL
ncbi:hypothetical protein E2C01_005612 [Portunus trituberculatus]|uniref:Uncharacterized protein n=1 Tax=Portunus trituberculatus TaxID=210409 RepID=A0A5B7CX30_PORTR|nr:hypothetical protein [Portunus trituberculatus]